MNVSNAFDFIHYRIHVSCLMCLDQSCVILKAFDSTDTEFVKRMDAVESLKVACCKCIAKYDIVEVLEPVADYLPVKVVAFLLSELDEFQFGQFQGYVSKGANIEILFIPIYKTLCQKIEWRPCTVWKHEALKSELECYSFRYWESKIASAIMANTNMQDRVLFKICTRVPHFVVRLKLRFAIWSNKVFQLLPLLTHVRHITFKVNDNKNTKKIFAVCKNWMLLEEIKLINNDQNIQWMPLLKELLKFKIHQNKSIVLSIHSGDFGCFYRSHMLSLMGGALHGMSGLKLCLFDKYIYRPNFLAPYSKVECIKVLKLKYLNGADDSLLDIIKHAPPCTNANYAISRLHLKCITISNPSFTAFQHWRFSRIERFYMAHISIDLDKATLLAEHAMFWPFAKQIIFRSCSITTNGFSVLLPAMVRGRGCENLVDLDVSCNACETLETFTEFLSSNNLTKLKALAMLGYGNNEMTFPMSFLTCIQKLTLSRLHMEYVVHTNQEIHPVINHLCTSSNDLFGRIIIYIKPGVVERVKEILKYQLSKKRKPTTTCLPKIQVNTIVHSRIHHFSNVGHVVFTNEPHISI